MAGVLAKWQDVRIWLCSVERPYRQSWHKIFRIWTGKTADRGYYLMKTDFTLKTIKNGLDKPDHFKVSNE
jgi:hypothetical protein